MSGQLQDCLVKIEQVLSGEIAPTNIETCVEALKDGQAIDVVPVLERVLCHWHLPVTVHTAAVKTLGHLGTESAIIAMCSVFTHRTRNRIDGYGDWEHDLLCKTVTAEVCAIGTFRAFQELVREIDRAIHIEAYSFEWLRHDVRNVLGEKIAAEVQRNLIYAMLNQPISDTTRQTLLAYLRRDAQTALLLTETLSPGQPGYSDGRGYLVNLQEHLENAASLGDDPTKYVYMTIQHPPNLDRATAIRFQSLFSQARVPSLARHDLDRINAELRNADLPPIDSNEEVPLAHLKIDYPHKSRLALLKHATVSRAEVGVFWVSTNEVLRRSNQDEGVIAIGGELVLTSLRLTLLVKATHQPDVPSYPDGGKHSAIVNLLLRDLVDVKFEFPVIVLRFDGGIGITDGITVSVSVAYPGASLLSAVSGFSLSGEPVKAKLTAAEIREYNRVLDAKGNAAQAALSEFFVEIVNRNLSHGVIVQESMPFG